MKNRWMLRAVVLLLLAALLNVTFSAAADAGSSKDPLVSLSYLNDTYLTTVLSKVDSKIDTRNAALKKELSGSTGGGSASAADTFTVVTLSKGKTLKGDIGCEVLLRIGSATCVASSAPGLVDETTAGTINSGAALTKNHLYMMTIENRGVKATSTTVKLLVRGGYSVA